LQDGNLDSTDLSQYGYCDADGSVMTGEFYDKCLACVSASGDTNYITNGMWLGKIRDNASVTDKMFFFSSCCFGGRVSSKACCWVNLGAQ